MSHLTAEPEPIAAPQAVGDESSDSSASITPVLTRSGTAFEDSTATTAATSTQATMSTAGSSADLSSDAQRPENQPALKSDTAAPEAAPASVSSGEASAPATAKPTGAANTQTMEKIPQPCLYKVGRELGNGTYSVVKEAMHVETFNYFAAKVINKRLMRGREHLVRNEIVVLKRLSKGHPNILTLVDYFETENNLYLITELAKGGELFDRIYSRGSFYESDAAKMIREITDGVNYLHSHGIVHRDLKPENLLFKTTSESSRLLIADFGLSRIIDEERLSMLMTTCGTPSYMAPEIFTKAGHAKPVDVWAIGVITYFLLSGYTPFDRDTPAEERQAILAGEFEFAPVEYWIHVSGDAVRFIKGCLASDPAQRMTAAQCLEHPFLTKRFRKEPDLLPNVMSNLSLRRQNSSTQGIPSTLEGSAMGGVYSLSPEAH